MGEHVANRKVSIIEKVKREDGTWTNLRIKIPKAKPNGKGLYLEYRRTGKYYLLWREGGQRRYHPVPGSLSDAITAKEQKEQYLASVAKSLKVEDPIEGRTRLTISAAIDEFLSTLIGRGNTVPLYGSNLRQFQEWNAKTARNKKTFLDQIDRQHVMAFKKWCQEQGGKKGEPNDELTAVWKCIRLNRMIKTMLNLPAGKGPVSKSDFAEILNRKPTVGTYSKDERERFLAACKGVAIISWTLFLKCGLRVKELSHLEWTDFEWAEHIIHVRRKMVKNGDRMVEFIPKKWSIRDVAVPDELFALFLKLKETSTCNLVFPTRGGRINTKLWDQCKRIAKRAELDVTKACTDALFAS